MTSQPLGPNTSCVNVTSFIRGYHAYQENWLPSVGENLVLEREPLNPVDGYAVTIVRSGTDVGYVPRNLSALFFHFLTRNGNKGVLTRNGNKGVTEVTGMKVNRGAGYGLEIPCVYRLYGPNAYIQRLETAVEDIQT